MKKKEAVSAILLRKWIRKECPFPCKDCNFKRECSWGMLINGDGKVKIVLRL